MFYVLNTGGIYLINWHILDHHLVIVVAVVTAVVLVRSVGADVTAD